MKSISTNLKPTAVFGLMLALTCAALFVPETAMAITFPNIPGVAAGSDPVTILAKLAAYIFKVAVYVLFVAAFAVGAYVAIATLLRMVKDRDNASDLVGKLLASVAVVVICYWFLAEGEKAADDLAKVKISHIVVVDQHPLV